MFKQVHDGAGLLVRRSPRGLGRDPRRGVKTPLGGMRGQRPMRTLSLWVLIVLVAVFAMKVMDLRAPREHPIPFTEFEKQIEAGNVAELTISGTETPEVHGKLVKPATVSDGTRAVTYTNFRTDSIDINREYVQEIRESNPGIKIEVKKPSQPWFQIFLTYVFLPILLFFGLWMFVLRQMQSGGSAALKFGKSRAKILMESNLKVTFNDVAGCDEAKQELQEIIDFLRDPKRFQALGGRIPKGALLLGAPGTGKTLLAKAVAGEAGVPFFSMSGSDFVEMFVGVGASRVRDLFEQGKRHAPCIIFIDEIDAVGRHRGAGLGGGHDEREQTLNQLLVEMDGFESNEGVILIAATNRPDVLDPALLRPGRFDRQIVVDRPDVRGREGILRVHTRKIPLAKDVDLQVLARGTPGLAGAELANMVNEAALLAARKGRKQVMMNDFEEAKDKVMMGAERKSLLISDEEKKVTAYHEAGHAVVGWFLPDMDPLHKVTVIPRGRALGVTHFLPADDRYTRSKEYLEQLLAMMMGGRAAEETIFQSITSGAADDIRRATELARKMVCDWGMSEKLGPLAFGQREEMIFLGREIAQHKDYSEATAVTIDAEVRAFVESAYARARKILEENTDKLRAVAQALLERELLDGEEINTILTGGELPPHPSVGTPSQPSESPARKVSTARDRPGETPELAGGEPSPSTA
jgi:cell division protease FtsH